MYLPKNRYLLMVTMQLSLLLIDLIINSSSDFFRKENIILLIIYIIQDFCLVFSLISIFLNLFSTFIFQAGLIGILLNRFKITIILCILYLILTISLHICSLTLRWNNILKPMWTDALLLLFTIQRLTAAVYYYFYKQTILCISDPRYYEDFRWVRNEMDVFRGLHGNTDDYINHAITNDRVFQLYY